jgi:hypothetical protein
VASGGGWTFFFADRPRVMSAFLASDRTSRVRQLSRGRNSQAAPFRYIAGAASCVGPGQFSGPDPFADSTYLEGEPPKQHA